MLYFVEKGYRVIAHDRRGHGRSSQVSESHDMDHYAAAVVEHLDLRDAIDIGHSTGGGEARTMSRATARAVSPSSC
jgi:non-heme chloroperoxidase